MKSAPLQNLQKYTTWLHGQWPSGLVEKLPEVRPNGSTAMGGVWIVGDLTSIPLLKFSADSGACAVRSILQEPEFITRAATNPSLEILDLAIIGAGISGVAAAIEAKKNKLSYQLFESSQLFSTISNMPKGKPIYTYPTAMIPAGELQFNAHFKETLLEELKTHVQQHGIQITETRIDRIEKKNSALFLHHADGQITQARRIIIAIGRTGNFRRLNIPGENLNKVTNRLIDPAEYVGKNVLVVGGGDSALETALALNQEGAHVTLSYRNKEFNRPKAENLERLEHLSKAPLSLNPVTVMLNSEVKEILPDSVLIETRDKSVNRISNDTVFCMLGREAPLDFFRRSGLRIKGEWTARDYQWMAAFLLFCVWLYHWKSNKEIPFLGKLPEWLVWHPATFWSWLQTTVTPLASSLTDASSFLGTLKISASGPSFYYTLVYSIIIIIFGLRRIKLRKTPYIKAQTTTLMVIQCLPLFLLPELILPLLGHNGFFNHGWLKTLADEFFPIVTYAHGREYWRAYGLILAWPLFVYNWFTSQPMVGWLIVGFIQTFVIIPLIVWRWGKGAYCGWICSCGALAETLGDAHRHKMPHGPGWNKLNMLGQVILGCVLVLMFCRILAWMDVAWAKHLFDYGFKKVPFLNYSWFVDTLLSGILGCGLYFWYSGRTWCRFACPLAALMHIYARFTRFRIFAEKSKCISCNVCTSVCHQGIDVMSVASKGLPMEDPQCVRCSACVQSCPTGVLSFGRYAADARIILDTLPASLVQMNEARSKKST